MLIIPAIDLMEGKCVRLEKGDFDAVTEYTQPTEQLPVFISGGAEWIHIVDLDGAKVGVPRQHGLISELVSDYPVKIQAAGGVRVKVDVEALLLTGVSRVVIGSLAVVQKETVKKWLTEFGSEKITLALDVQVLDGEPVVATHGWTESSGILLWDLIEFYINAGLAHVLVTDVSQDGMLTGPNLSLMREVKTRYSEVALQASGGVGSLKDIQDLKDLGADAAIVGRALYEKKFALNEAIYVGM